MNEIEELQMKVAFQDDTIEALNQAVITQQKQIEKLNFQVQHVTNKLKELSVSNQGSQEEEPPPPHY